MKLAMHERVKLAALAQAENRICQGCWRKIDKNGHELVCIVAAFGDDIKKPEDFPANLMPRWLVELIYSLGEGIQEKDIFWFGKEFITLMKSYYLLDETAWNNIREQFLTNTLKLVFEILDAKQPTDKKVYKLSVENDCLYLINRLENVLGFTDVVIAVLKIATTPAVNLSHKKLTEILFSYIEAEIKKGTESVTMFMHNLFA